LRHSSSVKWFSGRLLGGLSGHGFREKGFWDISFRAPQGGSSLEQGLRFFLWSVLNPGPICRERGVYFCRRHYLSVILPRRFEPRDLTLGDTSVSATGLRHFLPALPPTEKASRRGPRRVGCTSFGNSGRLLRQTVGSTRNKVPSRFLPLRPWRRAAHTPLRFLFFRFYWT